MEANATLKAAAVSQARVAGTPPPRVRELFRTVGGVPAGIALWIAVVATGLAALTVGALIIDHEQHTEYLRVSGAP